MRPQFDSFVIIVVLIVIQLTITLTSTVTDDIKVTPKKPRQIFIEEDDQDTIKPTGQITGHREPKEDPPPPVYHTPEKSFSTGSKSSKIREEFNGFPADFMQGLKPFDFQETSGSHRSSKSTGFVQFNIDDHKFPSLVSTLGGLKPFSALASIDNFSTQTRKPITPDSFGDNADDHQLYAAINDDEKPKQSRYISDWKSNHNRESNSRSSQEDQPLTLSSNVVSTVLKPKQASSDNPDSASASQHLMPHFINGGHVRHLPPPYGNYQRSPPPPPPQIRHFRQASHRPPFFVSPNNNYGPDGFFPGSVEFTSGPTSGPSSHFETRPERFSQPQFRFPGERQRKLPPPLPQPPHVQLHIGGDDSHQGASATTNILGSGNFGVIRGGLFADDDNPEQSISPFHGGGFLSSGGGGGHDDFFHGFRDFQPFGGGPMHNALSSKSHNIQRSQSKTFPVIVPINPSSTSTVSNKSSTSLQSKLSTTSTSGLEINKTFNSKNNTEAEEQLMEEK